MAGASNRCGMGDTWLSSWLRASSTVEPSAIALHSLAQILGCSMEDLFQVDNSVKRHGSITSALDSVKKLMEISNAHTRQAIQLLNRQSANEVMNAWLQTNGQIDGRFDGLWDYFDILELSEEGAPPNVTHMGALSLAANELQSKEVPAFQKFLQSLSPNEVDEINTSMQSVLQTSRGTVSNPQRLIPRKGGDNRTVDFVRLHLPGKLPDGNASERKVIINIAHYY